MYFLSSILSGSSLVLKSTKSSPPRLITSGTFFSTDSTRRIFAFGPYENPPPKYSDVNSCKVRSRIPSTSPFAAISSMVAPPTPVAWNPITSSPIFSNSSTAATAPVFVTPINVTATTGLSPFVRTCPAHFTIPTQQAQALEMT